MMLTRRNLVVVLFSFFLLMVAGPDATAGESFAGRWSGSYRNSTGQTARDSLVLTEGTNGELRGTWTGNIPVYGRRLNSSSAQLNGRTSTRAYQMTVTVSGNAMVMNYTATRLDSAGSYTGTARFHRR
jgi:hypothetical protein